MKKPDRLTVSELTDLPNIGKAIAGDLRMVGIQHPKDLIGKDAYKLHDKLCRITGTKHDPCMIDVFLSVVDFMNGGEAKVWWSYTEQRKKYLERKR